MGNSSVISQDEAAMKLSSLRDRVATSSQCDENESIGTQA